MPLIVVSVLFCIGPFTMLFGGVRLPAGTVVDPPTASKSGGLGLTKAEWEARHKIPEGADGPISVFDYENRSPEGYFRGYDLQFWRTQDIVTNDSIIYSISADPYWVLSDTLHIPPDQIESKAREYQERPRTRAPSNYLPPPLENLKPGEELLHMAARALMPDDAQLQETKWGGLESILEIYKSRSLETRYLTAPSGRNPWGGKPPGMILVTYARQGHAMLVEALLDLSGMPPLRPESPVPTDTPWPTPNATELYTPPRPVKTLPRPVATVSAP